MLERTMDCDFWVSAQVIGRIAKQLAVLHKERHHKLCVCAQFR